MYADMLKTDGDIIITQKGVADTFFSDVNTSIIDSINALKGVKEAQAVIVGAGAINTIPIAGIYGVSPNRFSVYKLSDGHYPTKGDELIIGEKIDTILKHPKNLRIFNENFTVAGVFQSDIGFENGGVVMKRTKASQLFKKDASFLLVSLQQIDNSKKIIQNIKRLNPNIDVKSTDDFINNYNQFKIINISGTVIASISFFMGFLAIVSIMSIVINDRRYEFGIKRAVGISRSRIILEVVTEVVVLITIAYLIALIASYYILEVLKSIDKFQGYLSGEITVNLMAYIFTGSLIMSIIGALIPAFLASKVDPIILIHQGD